MAARRVSARSFHTPAEAGRVTDSQPWSAEATRNSLTVSFIFNASDAETVFFGKVMAALPEGDLQKGREESIRGDRACAACENARFRRLSMRGMLSSSHMSNVWWREWWLSAESSTSAAT